ncbi:uncharacterized protein LOC115670910 isoform X3 [Syzygium oleosum]|uniref:uncharacterized protein LOC115670910 isoform X3 n=1 Tax=Syzygium oleosum TaxID=219896 RepID=UPI0024B8D5A2|nr:uncharacterized protein LOC115670910 isoform X3 [Syzygium oleosum]
MVIESDMGTSDPHSRSYTSHTNCNSPHCSSLGWDLHNLGVLNADMSLVMWSAVMGSTPPYFSDLDSDHNLSTGYLEDALLEFGDRSKRRRLSFCGKDQTKEFNDRALVRNGYWNSTCRWGVDENYNGMSEITSFTGFSDEMGSSRSRTSEDTSFFPEVKMQEDVVSSLDSSSPFKESSSRTKSGTDKEGQFALDAMPLSGYGGEKRRRQERVVVTRVVYPFAVVKPGGADGDVTLNDINERLLMPPTRPVRHPVGDFACRPCVSPHGPGLSGKAVVALTRLHTQGRGTITIIRTRG